MQYTKGVWEQLVVSAAGILIMIAAAWLLDRVEKVPEPVRRADRVRGTSATGRLAMTSRSQRKI